ncbi:hypothetical protein ACFQBQ_17170 [Granulicella cerasi]|uniref:Uncharacterized protein n=1 Tax=Granulicella cerasi TaxID=741063 RepID=A0ABW1ZFT9_9BACT|nr:hypothetical protein [Granulicella cerasi]
MSLSTETRRKDALALLSLLYVKLGDSPIDCTAFDCADVAYAAIQKTSWEELVSEGLLAKRGNSLYFFTAKGWSEALFRCGNPSGPELNERLGKLSKVLKDSVKGRGDSVLVRLDQVTIDSGLSPGWVFNAIDARLICIFGRNDAGWVEGARGRLIEVPRDFGLMEIDIFADLRAENLKLAETVERMEELYADYRCSFCSSPLISRTPWEHEYGTEEFSEYACGMTIGAPHGDAPCTKDPKFPKFVDYVLDAGIDGDVWRCYATAARAQSPASLVQLYPTYGQTEDEARESMRKRCADRAKH